MVQNLLLCENVWMNVKLGFQTLDGIFLFKVCVQKTKIYICGKSGTYLTVCLGSSAFKLNYGIERHLLNITVHYSYVVHACTICSTCM